MLSEEGKKEEESLESRTLTAFRRFFPFSHPAEARWPCRPLPPQDLPHSHLPPRTPAQRFAILQSRRARKGFKRD